MKTKTFLYILTGSIIAAGLAAGRAAAGDLPEVRIVAKAPYGAVQDISAAAAITATFNQPMAPLTSAKA